MPGQYMSCACAAAHKARPLAVLNPTAANDNDQMTAISRGVMASGHADDQVAGAFAAASLSSFAMLPTSAAPLSPASACRPLPFSMP